MKRGLKRPLALLLALFMVFGAAPVAGITAFAADTLKDINLSIGDKLSLEVGEKKEVVVTALVNDGTTDKMKTLNISDVSLSSTDTNYVKVENGVIEGVKATVDKDGKPLKVKDSEGNKIDLVVKVKAYYTSEGGITKNAECVVTVTAARVLVDEVRWTWSANAVLAGKTYTFAKNDEENNVVVPKAEFYSVLPSSATDKSVSIASSEPGIIEINNETFTIKVNELPEGFKKKTVTLTMTANDPSSKCQPKTLSVTVYNEVPVTSIEWTYKTGSTGKVGFQFMDNDYKPAQIAKYYFMPTKYGDPNAEYKFRVKAEGGLTLEGNILDLFEEVTFESSDERVIVFNEEFGRLIPVGNGESVLTVTAKTKHKQFKATVIGVVQGSPYTPITSLKIGYDEAHTDTDGIDYDSGSNRLTMLFSKEIRLIPLMNNGASLKNEKIEVELDDGEVLKLNSPITYSWSSDDTDVATVNQNGDVEARGGSGNATIKLTIKDNGKTYEATIRVRSKMSTWEIIVAIWLSFFTGHWNKIPKYFSKLF